MSYYNNPDVELDKEIEVDVDIDWNTDIDVDIDKDVDIDVNVDVYTDVEGNFAEVVFDAEAIGYDTYVQADLTVIAIEDELSHASGVITVVAG